MSSLTLPHSLLLSLLYLPLISSSMSCTSMDPTFGLVQLAADLNSTAGRAYNYGFDVYLIPEVDVTCTYVSYNGFSVSYQEGSG